MVVQHHVWFQFKEGTPAEKIAELHDALMAVSLQHDALQMLKQYCIRCYSILLRTLRISLMRTPKLRLQLKGKIPEIKHISFGRNFTTRAGSFTHGLTVVLDSVEGGLAVENDGKSRTRRR